MMGIFWLSLLVTFILLINNKNCAVIMASNVGIIPNASDVRAIVKDRHLENGTAYVTLHILTAEDYKSMPNFIKGSVGEDIQIVVSKDDLVFLDMNKQVNVLVSILGDEQGQYYTARLKP
jgi:hypothetical protein